ncbi:hypothetical protein EDF82_0094 [Raoultella sp. BIGb0399]|nr:hypothetical protein EDF82_0094 [Raoultella sp. BIGb0399]
MTLRYYLRHCLWGWCGQGYLIYFIVRDMYDGHIFPPYIPFMPYAVAYLVFSAITYPFAYYASENMAFKIMSKDFWDKYLGERSSACRMFIFVYLFCILFSAPLFIIY